MNDFLRRSMLTTTVATMALTMTATAATETLEATYDLSLSPGFQIVEVPKFDDHGGTRVLLEVHVNTDGLVGAAATIENDSQFSTVPAARIEVWGDTVVTAPGLAPSVLSHHAFTDLPANTALASSDGVPGAGDDFHDYGFFAESKSTSRSTADAAALAAFTGAGTVAFDIEAAGFVYQDYDTGMNHTFVVTQLVAEGTLEVTYVFDVIADACAGDLDGSGAIGFPDLMALLEVWGTCPDAQSCPADLTGSGTVGFGDLDLMLRSWGDCP